MSDEEPKFDFSEGCGATLGSLPCFSTVSRRGAACDALESALEPVHRLVYGRPGKAGERRSALESFKGFPPSMKEAVEEKMGKLTKDRLRDMVKALGIGVKVSLTLAELATGVTSFLMAPKDEGRIKDTKAIEAAKREARAKKAAVARSSSLTTSSSPKRSPTEAEKRPAESSTEEKTAKQAKTESKAPSSTPASPESSGPSDDAVLVEVYRRVLAMPFEERAVLGVKGLRTKLEEHFKLPAGGLKAKKDIITTTASDCVRALREAELRAMATVQEAEVKGTAEPVGSGDEGKTKNGSHVEREMLEERASPVAPTQTEAAPVVKAPATSQVAPMHPGVTPL